MLMLKKMKNSRSAAAFSTWLEALAIIKAERAEEERLKLLEEFQKRFSHLSAAQIEAKLRQFILRWQNAKKMPAFRTWKDMIEAVKLARSQAAVAAELAAMRAKMAQMGDNAALAKLKIYFKKKLEGLKSTSFQALCVHVNQMKARKMLDSEAGKRIKAFLKAKLAGIGRRCWQAWLNHHNAIAAENIKNNNNAKKVGLLLEKLARGIMHRCFSAFVRFATEMTDERAAGNALADRMALLDDLQKAKLRVFLDMKMLGKMSGFFKHWSNVATDRGGTDLLAAIEAEDQAIRDMEDRIRDAVAALAGQGDRAGSLEDQQARLQDQIVAELRKHADLQHMIDRTNTKTAEQQDYIADAVSSNSKKAGKGDELEQQLRDVNAECAALAAQLARISMSIGGVYEDSYTAC